MALRHKVGASFNQQGGGAFLPGNTNGLDAAEAGESNLQVPSTPPGYVHSGRRISRRRAGTKRSSPKAQYARIFHHAKRSPDALLVLLVGTCAVSLTLCILIPVVFYSTRIPPSLSLESPELVSRQARQTTSESIGAFPRAPTASEADKPIQHVKSHFWNHRNANFENYAPLSHPREIVLPRADSWKQARTDYGDLDRSISPPRLRTKTSKYQDQERDFGGIQIRLIMDDEGARRNVFRDAYLEEMVPVHDPDKQDDDVTDTYYAFDDDVGRQGDLGWVEPFQQDHHKIKCRRMAEHRVNFQTCNAVHELALLPLNVTYLSEGAYRQVFSLSHDYGETIEPIVVKELSFDNDFVYDNYEFIRMDAMVAERLSGSPRTFDIFGFCGLSILSEFFQHGDFQDIVLFGKRGNMKAKDLHDKDDVQPQNNLTGIQKLVASLEMVEGLAELHGYSNGLIIHDDVQLSQYLFNADRSLLKLNDFNRAEFALWDEEHHEYCQYKNGKGGGNWRSPEEYKNHPLTEQIDVWSVANNMYATLTGLNPFYDKKGVKEVVASVKGGTKPFLDSRYKKRSKAEKLLVEILETCYSYEPFDRPTIFSLVEKLRKAVDECLQNGETRVSVLQSIPVDPNKRFAPVTSPLGDLFEFHGKGEQQQVEAFKFGGNKTVGIRKPPGLNKTAVPIQQ